MDPDKMMNGIFEEIDVALKAMRRAKASEEKRVHSEIVRNLSESLGVFFNMANDLMSYDDDDDESDPF